MGIFENYDPFTDPHHARSITQKSAHDDVLLIVHIVALCGIRQPGAAMLPHNIVILSNTVALKTQQRALCIVIL